MSRAELKQLAYYRMQQTGERQGQACWNILSEIFPEEIEWARGTSRDPFYNDGVLDLFLDAIGII